MVWRCLVLLIETGMIAAMKHDLTRADILPMSAYAAIRNARRKEIIAQKVQRRLEVGPHATFYFENYDSMWLQIHEMLYIEKGGEDQIGDELRAYAPLVPNGRELVATVMFEIEAVELRHRVLATLGGVENCFALRFAGQTVKGIPEQDIDRTSADGKASSVQFAHFPFTAAQVMAFRQPETDIVVDISHPAYSHSAKMPEAMRLQLMQDFT